MDVLTNLGINIGYLIMQIALFVTFIVLLRHFLYQPILHTLGERRERVAKGLEDARQAAIARDNADAEAKKILEAARAEAARLRQQATEQAEETGKGIVRSAESEARQIVADARADALEERNRALGGVRDQVTMVAMAVAQKLIGETLDVDRQRALISEYIASPPADVSTLSGEKAVVTSALPLTDREKQRVEQMLNIPQVDYTVNPDILGGLIIRVGDQVVDASLANQMMDLRESLV